MNFAKWALAYRNINFTAYRRAVNRGIRKGSSFIQSTRMKEENVFHQAFSIKVDDDFVLCLNFVLSFSWQNSGFMSASLTEGTKLAAQQAMHSQYVLQLLQLQRRAGFLCDITINIEEKSFKAHKPLLAACSLYFRWVCLVKARQNVKSYNAMVLHARQFLFWRQNRVVTVALQAIIQTLTNISLRKFTSVMYFHVVSQWI